MFPPHTQKKSPWKLIRFLAKPSVLEKLLQKTEIFVIAWNSHMVAHPVISFWCRPLPGFSLRQRRIIFLLGSCPIHLWALAQIGQWFFGPVSPCVMLMKWMKWRWVKGRPKTHPERCLEGSNLSTCINMYQHHSKCINMYSINIHTTSITTIFWSSPWCYRWLLTLWPIPSHGHRSVALEREASRDRWKMGEICTQLWP